MFVAFWEVQRFTREVHELEKQMLDKQNELMHLQAYAGRLGGSSILNIGNLAGLSAELLPRATMFAQYSDQASSMSAMQNLQMMKMMGRVPITGNQLYDMQIQTSAYNQFKQAALKALKEQEVNAMYEKEKEIQLELNTIKTRLEEKRESLKNCKQLLSEQARESAVSFSLT